jgi:segregation and condensation protein B
MEEKTPEQEMIEEASDIESSAGEEEVAEQDGEQTAATEELSDEEVAKQDGEQTAATEELSDEEVAEQDGEQTAATEELSDEEVAEQDGEQAAATEELSDEELRAIIEVLLLVSDKPISIPKIKDIVGGAGAKKIKELIAQSQERLLESGFPYQIREIGGGYVLATLPQYSKWIRKLHSPKTKATKLSQAALETLAVVAYKQPVTRGEIEAIRGVNVDSTLRTLLEKRLAEIVGYKDVIGKPATYGTTSEVLLHFGLNTITDLPSIDELRRSDQEK